MRLALIAIFLCVSAIAQVDDTPRLAPDIPKDVIWLDQSAPVPHTLREYRGRVVLIDFWEYTCINCIRDFAVVKRWYSKYHDLGFEVIGIHFGEFAIAHNVGNVRAAAQRFRLPWPVVDDEKGSAWRAFQSNVWPNRYLIDAKGNIVLQVEGEGNNQVMEQKIRDLLARQHPEAKKIALDPDEAMFGLNCGVPTQETYVGDWFGRGAVQQHHKKNGVTDFTVDKPPRDGGVLLSGRWLVRQEGATSAQQPQSSGTFEEAKAGLKYHARSLYAVLSVEDARRPVRAYILQDGKPLTQAEAGRDVHFDDLDSYVEVSTPRMYYLIKNSAFSQHTILLRTQGPGFTIHSFTFGNNCQQDFDPL
jgi:thiol-disulfide isomerase/thioredoxin